MRYVALLLLAAAGAFASSIAEAQTRPSATAVGSKISGSGGTVGGTAGSAAAGGTSASTIGLGASSTGDSRTSSAVGGAGSAAAVNGRATSTTRTRENPQMLRSQSRAMAMDSGTFSRSMTSTNVRHDGNVWSWTRSMAHEPGSKPVMSTARVR
jgi:hypothetical protein